MKGARRRILLERLRNNVNNIWIVSLCKKLVVVRGAHPGPTNCEEEDTSDPPALAAAAAVYTSIFFPLRVRPKLLAEILLRTRAGGDPGGVDATTWPFCGSPDGHAYACIWSLSFCISSWCIQPRATHLFALKKFEESTRAVCLSVSLPSHYLSSLGKLPPLVWYNISHIPEDWSFRQLLQGRARGRGRVHGRVIAAAKQGALQRRSRSHAQKPAGEEGNRRRTRAEQRNGEGFEVTREGPTTDDPRSWNPGAQNQLLKSGGKPTGTRSEKKRKGEQKKR